MHMTEIILKVLFSARKKRFDFPLKLGYKVEFTVGFSVDMVSISGDKTQEFAVNWMCNIIGKDQIFN